MWVYQCADDINKHGDVQVKLWVVFNIFVFLSMYHWLEASTPNRYTIDEPMIYHTRGEHANRYTIDEPMIYHTRDEHANRYTFVFLSMYHCPCVLL
jgi:hypothetical protein